MKILQKNIIVIEIEDLCDMISQKVEMIVGVNDIESWEISKEDGSEKLERIIITLKAH